MASRYKVVISNKRLYKEIDLPVEEDTYTIGTSLECNFRLRKELFFEQFALYLNKQEETWQITCSENIYLNADVRKLMAKELQHGDELVVKYRGSDMELFRLSFVIGFEYEQKNYERIVDLSGKSVITIGGIPTCNIALTGEYVENDLIELSRQEKDFLITEKHTQYGVYVNGTKIHKPVLLHNQDFFSIANFSFYYKNNKLYTSKGADIQCNAIDSKDVGMQKSGLMYPKFNRNTRVLAVIPDQAIEVLNPPQKPEKPKENIVLTLLPSVGMLGLTVVLRGIMGSGSGSFVLFSACSMSLGIATTVLGFLSSGKEYRQQIRSRKKKYYKYIDDKKKEITAIREQERDILNQIYYSMDYDMNLVKDFSGDLFNRKPDEEDFLDVRIGTGDYPAKRVIEYKKQEKFDAEDELTMIPEELAKTYEMIQDAPIVIKLAKACAVGVVGDSQQLYAAMKNMILDICIRQHYHDVKLFLVVRPEQAELIRWTRFLPHLKNDDYNVRNIVCDDESKTYLFEYLYKELSRRESEKRTYPHIVILLFDEMGIKKHPIIKFISKAVSLGVTFVFFEPCQELLPQWCNEIVQLKSLEEGTLIYSQDSNDFKAFRYEPVDDVVANSIVMKLAPVYCEEVSLESTLTKNISLYELLNIFSTDDLDLMSRWQSSAVYKTLAAPIGVKTKGEVVSLDLHEKQHGPHGLVAGTTGSGKSEILQTYILSMATLFHPYDVSFVIIDFKGGGMANQFKDLPHLIGTITNIDGKEINRSLLSIKAELTKRQNLFAEADVNHIDKYIKKYKAGEVSQPLPHLIIIVDEFAELKAEQPEFMKELISAARIGRSLGVHLILATQKPAGQVNEQIWSNSKFKLCLKVQTKEDSNEVIKSPLAAEITEPGRAYFQVGNNEIFELFQSAYSGCPDQMEDDGSRLKEFELQSLDLTGKRKVIYSQKTQHNKGDATTQLEAIVKYVASFCEQKRIKKLASICLPPLKDCIPYRSDEGQEQTEPFHIGIGVYDDPKNQYQGTAYLDILNNNTMILGSSQSGKTNLLQLIIRGLAQNYSPKQVHIYIIDFASMVLKNYENLNHVGGVVCASEDEKLKNLFKLLNEEMTTRKEKLLSVGVSSFSSYLEAGYQDLAKIVLLIDNLTALKELYLQENDLLLSICREGLAVGISIVVANAQTSGIGYKYLSNFSNRISMYCNDASEYSNLFNYCKLRPEDIHGRCLIEIDRSIYECQTYLAFEGEKEIDRVNQIRQFIEELNSRENYQSRAKLIPVIPKLLTAGYIEKQFGTLMKSEGVLVNGLDYSTVTPNIIDLKEFNMIGLCGREKSGRGNYVRYFVNTLQNISESIAEVHIIDDVSKKFASLQSRSIVKNYTLNPEEIIPVVHQIGEQLETRYTRQMQGENQSLSDEPVIVLIIQNMDALEIMSKDKEVMELFKRIVTKYKGMKVTILFSNVANASIPFNAPEPLKMLKESKHFMVFDDLSNIKIVDVPLAVTRVFKKPLQVGDAYYFKGNECRKLKMALCQEN